MVLCGPSSWIGPARGCWCSETARAYPRHSGAVMPWTENQLMGGMVAGGSGAVMTAAIRRLYEG